jgi:hypothetical protein
MKLANLLRDVVEAFRDHYDWTEQTNPQYADALGLRVCQALAKASYSDIDREHLRQYWHSNNPLSLWSQNNGIAFDQDDYCQLAYLIWKRSGKNDAAAVGMYRRMMENDCPLSDFMFMVAHHVFAS